jgi:hypothetical protein
VTFLRSSRDFGAGSRESLPKIGSEEVQRALVGGLQGAAGESVALTGVKAGFTGKVFELAEPDELAGVDDRDLLILLAVKDQ